MQLLLASVIAFASTNIDDLFILTLFFGGKEFKASEIVAGQLLGIITLIVLSLLGSLAGMFIDLAYLGLLGGIPIYLGVKGIIRLIHHKKEVDRRDNQTKGRRASNILAVSGITLANGGDNIGVYIPLFASLTWGNKITMVTIFLVMTVFWCLIAKYFTKHPYVARAVDRYGHLVTPFVLILLGFYIIFTSGTVELFWK
jgi:cadmium resistance protein CadD (predicted permease)